MAEVNQYRQKRQTSSMDEGNDSGFALLIVCGAAATLLACVATIVVLLTSVSAPANRAAAEPKSGNPVGMNANTGGPDSDLAARRLRCRMEMNMWSLSAQAHGSSVSNNAEEVCTALEKAAASDRKQKNKR